MGHHISKMLRSKKRKEKHIRSSTIVCLLFTKKCLPLSLKLLETFVRFLFPLHFKNTHIQHESGKDDGAEGGQWPSSMSTWNFCLLTRHSVEFESCCRTNEWMLFEDSFLPKTKKHKSFSVWFVSRCRSVGSERNVLRCCTLKWKSALGGKVWRVSFEIWNATHVPTFTFGCLFSGLAEELLRFFGRKVFFFVLQLRICPEMRRRWNQITFVLKINFQIDFLLFMMISLNDHWEFIFCWKFRGENDIRSLNCVEEKPEKYVI